MLALVASMLLSVLASHFSAGDADLISCRAKGITVDFEWAIAMLNSEKAIAREGTLRLDTIHGYINREEKRKIQAS